MNKLEFKNITDLLSMNYGKELDIKILDIWYEELKCYPKERYEFTVKEIIKKENYMPNLATVLKYIKSPDWLNIDVEEEQATDEEIRKLEERIKNRLNRQ